jgi:thymidylate synthase
MGDYHIYEQHTNSVIEQLKRSPFHLPKLEIPNFKTINEVEFSTFNDYKIIDYTHHSMIKAEMVA